MAMDERDDGLDDLFRDIGKHLAGETVPPAFDAETPGREDHDELVAMYSRAFAVRFCTSVSRSSDPQLLVGKLQMDLSNFKDEFERILHEQGNVIEADLVSGLTYDDLEECAKGEIDSCERKLAHNQPNSGDYNRLKLQIRKLEIMKMTCYEAKTL